MGKVANKKGPKKPKARVPIFSRAIVNNRVKVERYIFLNIFNRQDALYYSKYQSLAERRMNG